jgi:hypothetical protein
MREMEEMMPVLKKILPKLKDFITKYLMINRNIIKKSK